MKQLKLFGNTPLLYSNKMLNSDWWNRSQTRSWKKKSSFPETLVHLEFSPFWCTATYPRILKSHLKTSYTDLHNCRQLLYLSLRLETIRNIFHRVIFCQARSSWLTEATLCKVLIFHTFAIDNSSSSEYFVICIVYLSSSHLL